MAMSKCKVPQLSESVAEATLLQWKKKVGDAVAVDEILIEVETDKVVLEVPAPSAGVIVEIVQADGATVVAAEQLIASIDTAATAGAAARCRRSCRARRRRAGRRRRAAGRRPPPPAAPRATSPCPPPPSCWPTTT